MNKSSYYYQSRKRPDVELKAKLGEKAHEGRRWGYRRLKVLLERDGMNDNHKRVFRVYQEAGLQVKKRKRRKQRPQRGENPVAPTSINQRWSLDFVHDSTAGGQKLRLLTIVDDHTRECPNSTAARKAPSPTTDPGSAACIWIAGLMNRISNITLSSRGNLPRMDTSKASMENSATSA